MNQEYYWVIELYSGELIRVKPEPDKIAYIQEMVAKQQGAITTPTRSIIVKDIKDFRVGDEMYSSHELLEASSQAFNEPIYTEGGGIESRWVKKSVPRRKWDSYFSKIPSYRLLEEGDSFVIIAFRMAVHDIDHTRVKECDDNDQMRLSRLVSS